MNIAFKKITLILLAAVFLPVNTHGAEKKVNLPALIKKISPTIVGLGTHIPLRSPRVIMNGTGFVILNGKYIVTNAHVIPERYKMAPKERVVVLLGHGEKPEVVFTEIIKIDKRYDLAILKLLRGPAASSAVLSKSKKLKPSGTEVIFTGFPLGAVMGLYPVTHKGMISAITPIIRPQVSSAYLDAHMLRQPRINVYQLDAVAYPGSSGSPVFDVNTGEVIAIINSVAIKKTKEKAISQPSGITFAIPVSHLNDLIKSAGLK
jgi:S1-C subfamily serine protease